MAEMMRAFVMKAITPCFQCDNCVRGYTSQCTQMLGGWKFANVKDGVFADYFHVNSAEANLAHIPDSVSDEQAVYTCDMMDTKEGGIIKPLIEFANGPEL